MILVPHPDPIVVVKTLDEATLKIQIDNIINLLEHFCETDWEQPVNSRLIAAWEGHECYLAFYGICHADELGLRRKATQPELTRLTCLMDYVTSGDFSLAKPPWFDDEKLNRSHQSQLVSMNPRFYGSLFPDIPPTLALVWKTSGAQ